MMMWCGGWSPTRDDDVHEMIVGRSMSDRYVVSKHDIGAGFIHFN